MSAGRDVTARGRWLDRRSAAALVSLNYFPAHQARHRALAAPRQNGQRQGSAAGGGRDRPRQDNPEFGAGDRSIALLTKQRRPG